MRRTTSIYEVDSRNLSAPLWFGLAIYFTERRNEQQEKKLIVGRLIATHWPTEKIKNKNKRYDIFYNFKIKFLCFIQKYKVWSLDITMALAYFLPISYIMSYVFK